MIRCKYRLPWNAEWRCHHVGWLFGRCFNHWLEQWRWEHSGTWGGWGLDLSNLNRPYVMYDKDHRIPEWVALSYGNGNSDPVWFIEVHRRRRPGA